MNEKNRRRILRLFFVFLFMLFFPFFPRFADAADTLKISIPDTVYAEGNVCSLSEVSDVDGPQALAKRAGELLLTIENSVITREQVIAALRVSGMESVRIELKMPETVRVEREGAPAQREPAPASARERGQTGLAELIKSLAAWDGDVEVQHQGEIPDGRLVAPASIVPGTSAATLRFRDASGRERSLAVRLAWTQPVLVLTRSLRRGDILKESDVTVRQIKVNRPGVYASRVSEVVGRSVTKNLSQGETLTLNSVFDAPIIERGKSVIILAKSGGLAVKAKGEALESGALGDTIRVRNVTSRTVLTAVVVAEDTVEVKMP